MRIRRLRDEAEAAIDAQGRVRSSLAGSGAARRDRRPVAQLLERARAPGAVHAYLENMAGRLSHELRTPIAVVRSSLENLQARARPRKPASTSSARERRPGAPRRDPHAHDRGDAPRAARCATPSASASTSRAVVRGCVEGYRLAYPQRRSSSSVPAEPQSWMRGRARSRRADARQAGGERGRFRHRRRADPRRARRRAAARASLTVSNRGPRLPEAMAGTRCSTRWCRCATSDRRRRRTSGSASTSCA